MKQYTLVGSDNTEALVIAVNKMISEGCQLEGGIAVGERGGYPWYMQALSFNVTE